jgi:transposase
VGHNSEVFIGLDVAKARHAVAIAEEGRQGEVRYFGEIDADPAAVRRMVARLAKPHGRLHFCYEAGPTGYGLYRQLIAMGHECTVVAPSLIPRKPGDRVKTNRRDATQLARLLRAGELTAVWVPEEGHEAMRELVRARDAAVDDLRRKRQSISSMMLRYGRIYPGKKTWGARHQRWLQAQRFEHPAQQLVLLEMTHAAQHALERLQRIDAALEEFLPTWSLAPVVDALQAL